MLMHWQDTALISGINESRTPLQNNKLIHPTWLIKINLLHIYTIYDCT